MNPFFHILIIVGILILLYLLFIMPRMLHKPDMEPFKGVLYAHRGLHRNGSDAPENSMEAFRRAVDAGFGIELDVQLTKDKVPVVFHDYTLKRMCGAEGKVCDYTFEELQQFPLIGSSEKIPKFEEVCRLVSGKVPLIVELKIEKTDSSVCPAADAVLKDYPGLYCIESFNPLGVYWYRRNRPRIVRGQLSDAFLLGGQNVNLILFLVEMLLLNFITKPDFIAYNHRHQGNLSRRLCHGLYRNTAVAYTIKSEEELRRARKHFDIYIFDSFYPQEST